MPAFFYFYSISSKLLKVIQIDFQKSEKILPRESSKDAIFKFSAIYLENWALERMPRFVVFRAFLAIFQRFLG